MCSAMNYTKLSHFALLDPGLIFWKRAAICTKSNSATPSGRVPTWISMPLSPRTITVRHRIKCSSSGHSGVRKRMEVSAKWQMSIPDPGK